MNLKFGGTLNRSRVWTESQAPETWTLPKLSCYVSHRLLRHRWWFWGETSREELVSQRGLRTRKCLFLVLSSTCVPPYDFLPQQLCWEGCMAGVRKCPCSSWRRGYCGTGAACSLCLVLAAWCTTGENFLLSALALVRESQGEWSSEGLNWVPLKAFYRAWLHLPEPLSMAEFYRNIGKPERPTRERSWQLLTFLALSLPLALKQVERGGGYKCFPWWS